VGHRCPSRSDGWGPCPSHLDCYYCLHSAPVEGRGLDGGRCCRAGATDRPSQDCNRRNHYLSRHNNAGGVRVRNGGMDGEPGPRSGKRRRFHNCRHRADPWPCLHSGAHPGQPFYPQQDRLGAGRGRHAACHYFRLRPRFNDRGTGAAQMGWGLLPDTPRGLHVHDLQVVQTGPGIE